MRLVFPLYVLATTPVWALSLCFYLAAIGIVWALRDYQEGLAYNTALSSQIGDAFLLSIVLMAVTLLQDGYSVPAPLNTWAMQIGFAAIGVLVGVLWIKSDPTKLWADRYHHTCLAPLLVYLMLNAAVILFGDVPRVYTVGALVLFALWAALAAFDHASGRIEQRQYLSRHGIHLKH